MAATQSIEFVLGPGSNGKSFVEAFMHYATVKGEKSVADLVNRLYQLPHASQLSTALAQKPGTTKALAAQAADALLRANPALADLAKLPPNTVIVVPAVSGLSQTAAALVAGDAAEVGIADIRTAVTASLTTMYAAAKSQLTELTAQQTALGTDPDWKALLKAFPEAKTVVAAVHTANSLRITGLKRVLDMQVQVQKELETELKKVNPIS